MMISHKYVCFYEIKTHLTSHRLIQISMTLNVDAIAMHCEDVTLKFSVLISQVDKLEHYELHISPRVPKASFSFVSPMVSGLC